MSERSAAGSEVDRGTPEVIDDPTPRGLGVRNVERAALGSGVRMAAKDVARVPLVVVAVLMVACSGAGLPAVFMPDLRGKTLDELGDGGGPLFDLQDELGLQTTRYVASNEVAEGSVVDQTPLPGTPLDRVIDWSVTVSAGGPALSFAEIPARDRQVALPLEGFDLSEPVLVLEVGEGLTAYKTDAWLFSADCAAIEAAYRTFTDPLYRWACPEGEGVP